MTSASGRGSYCGNMNVFSIGESSREGQKDLGADPTPLFFFFTLLGTKALQSMRGTLLKASAFGLYKLHESVPMHRWKGGLKEEGTNRSKP